MEHRDVHIYIYIYTHLYIYIYTVGVCGHARVFTQSGFLITLACLKYPTATQANSSPKATCSTLRSRSVVAVGMACATETRRRPLGAKGDTIPVPKMQVLNERCTENNIIYKTTSLGMFAAETRQSRQNPPGSSTVDHQNFSCSDGSEPSEAWSTVYESQERQAPGFLLNLS